MLHRSFKPAKCKTALKLAVSRIKLLKNKREAHVKQLKRELAQLIESGQDQTARIRVEHVVREEKTLAAYDLIEIYCELIAARMPIIESQKNCPIDLKEAISSVIFASPRCSDIPEIMDVRKHITTKFGKEFVSAALELRPDCGVSRLLVEKLSAKAPDGPTKIKILTAIAEEHNIKWEPKSFEENDINSSQFLQVGSNTYEKASYVEPPQVQVAPAHDEKGPPNVHASSQHKEVHDDMSTNLYEHHASYAAERVGGNKPTISGRSNPEIRSSGTGNQEMDFRDPSENSSSFPVGRQNWNMEFRDAASAARAAAESAERASMAARAAAELSNREKITRQYSTGSQSSPGISVIDEAPQEHVFHDEKHVSADHASMAAQAATELSSREKVTRQYSSESQSSSGRGLRDDVPQEYAFNGEKRSTGSVTRTFCNSTFGMHNEQIDDREQDNLEGVPVEHYESSFENVEKHGESAVGVNPFGKDAQMKDIYIHKNSFEQEDSEFLHDVTMKKQSSRTDTDFVSELYGDMNTQNNNYTRDVRMNQQSNKTSSSSHFIIASDDHSDVFDSQKMGNRAEGDLFITDYENIERNFGVTSSYNNNSVVFDDSGSEDDDNKFVVDKKYEGQGSSLYFSSPGSKLQIDPLVNKDAWSPSQVIDEKQGSSSSQLHFSLVPESLTKSTISFDEEELLPVTSDDSDGPSSNSVEDLAKSEVTGNNVNKNSVPNQGANHGVSGSTSRDVVDVNSDRKFGLSPSSGGSDAMEERFERNVDITSEKKFGSDDLPNSQPSSKGRSSVSGLDVKVNRYTSESPDSFNNKEALEGSYLESFKELNFGSLKGGLRNKGNRRPPYIKPSSRRDSSSLGDISAPNEQSSPTVRTSMSSDDHAKDSYVGQVSRRNRSSAFRAQNTSSDSESYDLVANSQEIVTSTQDPRTQKDHGAANKKSSSKASITYFDSDSSVSEDELPKQNSASRARPVSGFSRRTSASSKTGAGSSSNKTPLPEVSVTSSTGLGWKSSSLVSYESEIQEKASSWVKSSDGIASSGHRSAKLSVSKPIPDSNRTSHEETIKSSSTTQPSSSLPKTVISDGAEALNSSKSGGDAPSEEKASHVHPKLPDYDSFAAQFQSLKNGRQ